MLGKPPQRGHSEVQSPLDPHYSLSKQLLLRGTVGSGVGWASLCQVLSCTGTLRIIRWRRVDGRTGQGLKESIQGTGLPFFGGQRTGQQAKSPASNAEEQAWKENYSLIQSLETVSETSPPCLPITTGFLEAPSRCHPTGQQALPRANLRM